MTNTFHAEPPEDRFCDLVMKGGITSGVVYPKAISALARHYRFNSIGGTSAGAIAAALTAAAEYRRRCKGSREGFDLLDDLPQVLQSKVDGTRSKLLSLFQPQRGPHRLFAVLVSALNRGGTWRRVLAIVLGFLRAYWPATLGSVLLAWGVGATGQGVLAAGLAFVLAFVASIGCWVYLDLTRAVAGNGFGLCNGMTTDASHEALTPWLHAQIQRTAGLGPDDPPLTFGQLWDAPGYPPLWLKHQPRKPRSIDLRMFSTNLAHGRPYVFPLPEVDAAPGRFRDRERLYFRPEDLAPYLPGDVLQWMVKRSRPYAVEPGREGKDPDGPETQGLRELPPAPDFPVLLAARMSLSFPLLFSAVPLWAIDHDAPPGTKREMRRCWFSDGGISSNFPMHLFDNFVPLWPTFGITLEDKIPGRDEMVYLPEQYEKGYGERWNRFAEAGRSASRFGGFLIAIVSAMQNWNDNALSRMPGVRDRVVRVRLAAGEGGINLNMEQHDIEALSGRGHDAAKRLIARFVAPTLSGPQSSGWDDQRWVRLGVLMRTLEERAPGVLNSMEKNTPHVTGIDELIAGAESAFTTDNSRGPATGYEKPFTQVEREALQNTLEALRRLMEVLVAQRHDNPFKPIPAPELRVRPPL